MNLEISCIKDQYRFNFNMTAAAGQKKNRFFLEGPKRQGGSLTLQASHQF
jgi:hypothetical protein